MHNKKFFKQITNFLISHWLESNEDNSWFTWVDNQIDSKKINLFEKRGSVNISKTITSCD